MYRWRKIKKNIYLVVFKSCFYDIFIEMENFLISFIVFRNMELI